mmetsp:Transcript_50701/g.93738  ORF Transcript_50701/g.93738 Transcript_50701/m.93738 type:complete len:99 (+) Transcript_50701:3-299(+)
MEIENRRLHRQDQLRNYQKELFSDQPPLSPSTSSAVVQHFLSSTTRYMNTFAACVDAKLYNCSQRTFKLENQIGLLESKLASIQSEEISAVKKHPETQ